ncbi:MAG: hypothetical protein ACOYK6_00705 [Chthoniobacterales bacterium]
MSNFQFPSIHPPRQNGEAFLGLNPLSVSSNSNKTSSSSPPYSATVARSPTSPWNGISKSLSYSSRSTDSPTKATSTGSIKSEKLTQTSRISREELQETRQVIQEVYGKESVEAKSFKERFIPTTQAGSLFLRENSWQNNLQKKFSQPTRDDVKSFLDSLKNPTGTETISNRVDKIGRPMKEPLLVNLHLELDRFIKEDISPEQKKAILAHSEDPLNNPVREGLVDHLLHGHSFASDLNVTNYKVACDLADAAIARFKKEEAAKGIS